MNSILKHLGDFIKSKTFLQTILLGGIIFISQAYVTNKWTPITAAETLKRENFLNAKRDTYFEAIQIANRILAHTEFTLNGVASDTSNRIRGTNYPTEYEYNNCFAKLCIYAENKNIPILFREMAINNSNEKKPVLLMIEFIKLIREDLGYGKPLIDSTDDNYKYIQIRR